MKCIEARRMVTSFVNKELSAEEMEQFLHHVEHCADCMEELDIYFTMYKAFEMLDRGAHQELDFRKMLREEIHAARRSLLIRRVCFVLRGALVAVAELLLLICVYNGVFRV